MLWLEGVQASKSSSFSINYVVKQVFSDFSPVTAESSAESSPRIPRQPAQKETAAEDHGHSEEIHELSTHLRSLVQNKNHSYRLQSYPHCFVGENAIEKLKQSGMAESSNDAIGRMNELLKAEKIFNVIDIGNTEFSKGYCLYRFQEDVNIMQAEENLCDGITLEDVESVLRSELKPRTRRNGLQNHCNSILGIEAVNVLCKNQCVKDRQSAVLVCQVFVDSGFFTAVDNQPKFRDGMTLFKIQQEQQVIQERELSRVSSVTSDIQ
uniref:DEP domain-containing protein n=1 Tax=Timspurckia oligopyrenoides TaxID=708627 RepID=A0A7S1EQK4_9RHOD|mmetsp:Transcript_13058/g.23500  ORF Transcript_13058/g.23500 Transcript_13058/m.23500 type:complete len:266 (+) Transcript_13058:168-965(+)